MIARPELQSDVGATRWWRRAPAWLFAALAYVVFARAMVGFVLFVENLGGGPRISGPIELSTVAALGIDLALIVAFCGHHSVMARRPIKDRLQGWLQGSNERSLYVLVASLLLIALTRWWQPIAPVWWELEGWAGWLVRGLSFAGWLVAIAASWQLDHQRLFGFRPTLQRLLRRRGEPPKLVTRGLYAWCRHPIYLGTLIALWATPIGTGGHLLLGVCFSAYVWLGQRWEERDLLADHGAAAAGWVAATPGLWPRRPRVAAEPRS